MAGRVFPSIRNNPPSLRDEKAIVIFMSGPRYTKIAFQDIMPLNVAWHCSVSAVEGGVEMRGEWRGSYRVEHYVGWSSFDLGIWEATYFFFGTAGHFLGEKWKSPSFFNSDQPCCLKNWKASWFSLRMIENASLTPVQRWKFVIKALQIASCQEGMLWTGAICN